MPGQTGPKSRDGKSNSSQNARKHGARARTVIIGEERQEDFDRLAAGWRAEYEVEGQAAESLMERVILGDWLLRRAEGVYLDAEAELAAVPLLERTAEQHAQLALYLRYKTTAERSFYRAFYALRGLRKDKLREELDWEKVRRKMDAYAAEAVEKAEEKRGIQVCLSTVRSGMLFTSGHRNHDSQENSVNSRAIRTGAFSAQGEDVHAGPIAAGSGGAESAEARRGEIAGGSAVPRVSEGSVRFAGTFGRISERLGGAFVPGCVSADGRVRDRVCAPARSDRGGGVG